jgi:hypothetical protein
VIAEWVEVVKRYDGAKLVSCERVLKNTKSEVEDRSWDRGAAGS